MAAVVAVGAIAMLMPAAAPHAGVRYSDPRVLDRPGHGDSFNPRVAVDPAGRATVVWEDPDRPGSSTSIIQSIRLGEDGDPEGRVQDLSRSGASRPALAVDRDGRTTVVWERDVGPRDRPRIEFVRLGADGLPGGPVQAPADLRGTDPQVAVDAAGRATIVWRRGSDGIRLLRLSADGAPDGPIRTLAERASGAPRLAVDRSGRATVVWRGPRAALEAIVIGADGTPLGPVRKLGRGMHIRSPSGWQVAVGRSGDATVVWRGARRKWEIYAVRLNAAGRPGRVRVLTELFAKLPRVAVDRSGRATVVWQGKGAGRHFSSGRTRIRAVRLRAGGRPGRIRVLSDPSHGASDADVAVDPRGRATVVWGHDDGVSTRIQAIRLGANGKPERVRTLSAPGRPKQANACCPQVAVADRGRATVVWRRYDGKRFRIEATRSR